MKQQRDTPEIRPDPDPTVMTTDQLRREISSLQALIEARMDGIDERFKAAQLTTSERIAESEAGRNDALNKAAKTIQDGLDKAERQLQQALDRAQQELHLALTEAEKRVNEKFEAKDKGMDDRVTHLQALHAEKFESISIQFKERDTRTEQTSKDSKVAVDAALQAAKEAVGEQNKSVALALAKSEAATAKQMDQIGNLINATTLSLNDKIDDLKTRLTSIESRTNGAQTQKHETNQNWGFVFGLGGLLVAIISVVLVAFKVVT